MDMIKTFILHLLFYSLMINLKIFSTRMAAAQVIPVSVGVVIDMDDYGKMAFNSLSMALSDFYATHNNSKTRLVLINRDSKGDVVAAAAAGLDLIKNDEVQAIIGPIYSVQANFLISLGQEAQVPIITFSATSPSLSSLRSPYFVRATLTDSSQVGPIVAITQAFGWREVVLVYEDNEFGEGILPFLTDALEHVNARIAYRSVFPPLATDDQIAAELYKLMTMQTRVFVVHMQSRLASRMFAKAAQIGMMSKDYAWIVTDSIANEINSMNQSVISSMLGVIGVRPYIPKTKELDNFTIRYKKMAQQTDQALDPDIYKLWAYDSATALAMAAETTGLKNLTYQETSMPINSTDLETFGVSLSGPELIQALSNITFTGLAGNFRLVGGQLQAPPYEIVNIVGPGARVIGYWTKENGIVKELNFTSSTSTNAYSTSKSNLGSIIWPGDKSSPPKGWVVPTNGKKLRVGVPVKVSFTEFVRVTWNSDNTTTVEGYCIDVFDAVMAALPYGVPYEYIPFATPDHKIAGDYNDLAYQVYIGNYDVVAGDVTILLNRSQYVDFTLPYTESGVSMVVPIQDDKRGNEWLFMKPLTQAMWWTTLAVFVGIGVLIYYLERPTNNDFKGHNILYEVGMVFWFTFSTTFFVHKEKVVSNFAKVVMIVWLLTVYVLTQSYSGSLTSMLTARKVAPTVTDVNVLIRNNDYVGYPNTSFIFGFLKKLFNESRLVSFNSSEEMVELLSKGSRDGGVAAVFHEIPYIKLFLEKYCSEYMMVGPTYRADGFGFVFPKDSPLVPDVSRKILNVTEGQKMVEIEEKWLGDAKCVDILLPSESLRLSSFKGLFIIVGALGFVVLIVKYLCVRYQNSVVNIDQQRQAIQESIHDLHELLKKFNE